MSELPENSKIRVQTIRDGYKIIFPRHLPTNLPGVIFLGIWVFLHRVLLLPQ